MRRIEKLATAFPGVEVHAKLEFFNPGGSVKDRAALQMVKAGLASGALKPGTNTLIDSTSGNTGVAYAWLGAALGFKVALVMPANVSIARKQISLAYGAELLFSDPMEGSDGAIRRGVRRSSRRCWSGNTRSRRRRRAARLPRSCGGTV